MLEKTMNIDMERAPLAKLKLYYSPIFVRRSKTNELRSFPEPISIILPARNGKTINVSVKQKYSPYVSIMNN